MNNKTNKEITIFFVIGIPLFMVGYYLWIKNLSHVFLIFTPAIASILTRLILKIGFKDVSFKWPKAKVFLWAWALPILIGILTFVPLWAFNIIDFIPKQLAAFLPVIAECPILNFLINLSAASILVVGYYLATTIGEELGWRGFLLTRLIDSKVKAPIFISGIIWALFHLPLIWFDSYGETGHGNIFLQSFLFTINCILINYIISWLRLGSGSIYPSILFHSGLNGTINVGFASAASGSNVKMFTGESGYAYIIASLIILLILWWFRDKIKFMQTASHIRTGNSDNF